MYSKPFEFRGVVAKASRTCGNIFEHASIPEFCMKWNAAKWCGLGLVYELCVGTYRQKGVSSCAEH